MHTLPVTLPVDTSNVPGLWLLLAVLWYQLYVNPDRAVAKEMVQKAERNGCKVLCITVDAPQLGNREKDRRNKATKSAAAYKGKVTQRPSARPLELPMQIL